jgi:hypothetical protein
VCKSDKVAGVKAGDRFYHTLIEFIQGKAGSADTWYLLSPYQCV